ncbi:MAG: hypothetical protein U9Q75_11135, partial [Pseudomonadota bacterium]|nr:hypothetical protein [Pseudomonadota bacterium]
MVPISFDNGFVSRTVFGWLVKSFLDGKNIAPFQISVRIFSHSARRSSNIILFAFFPWLFNFFWVDWIMAKKINHRGRGGHRE